MEKNEMGWACSTYGGKLEVNTGFWWVNLKERDHLGDPGVDEKIILRWIFIKSNVGVTDWVPQNAENFLSSWEPDRFRKDQQSRVESNPIPSDSQRIGSHSVAYLQWPPRQCVHTSRVQSSPLQSHGYCPDWTGLCWWIHTLRHPNTLRVRKHQQSRVQSSPVQSSPVPRTLPSQKSRCHMFHFLQSDSSDRARRLLSWGTNGCPKPYSLG